MTKSTATDSPDLEISETCRSACIDYLRYLDTLLVPVFEELRSSSDGRTLKLHQVIGANLCAAHAIDYIIAIRQTLGMKETRGALLPAFDTEYAIAGARIQGGKMTLVDAVNNAMKHIRIEPKRYKDLIHQYGQISFECLVEDEGRILCLLDGFRFDYVRVVLLPVLEALCAWHLQDEEEVAEFARGGMEDMVFGVNYGDDDDDPINALITACNPTCINCEEVEEDCQCAEYIFAGETGEFEARFATTAELDTLFSTVSGAYRRDKLI
ncbi:hypothetical protein [Pseudomonas protegens]|uniref:hypothetical protein n=1 Tax=Pseudomonas protegens TaxID=380021 RepID=UPI00301DA000